ncbi:MAG: HAMP domain-containing sensor histidine kinase [Polyangiaceae bacterium]
MPRNEKQGWRMHSDSETPHTERTRTDESLRAERDRADEHFDEGGAAVEQDADRILELARQRADSLVVDARHAADVLARHGSHGAYDSERVVAARLEEDEALTDARRTADAKLEAERREHHAALVALLALEREETDDGLLQERARSDHAVSSRDEFLAIVSHDVRGLLSGLALSAAQLIKVRAEGAAGDRIHATAERIQRFTARMNRLVGDLLDVVSMESGKLGVSPEQQDATRLLAETMDGFQLAAAEHKVAMSAERPEHPVGAFFDHDRILQVLTNLVGNAMKFTEQGGHVTLRLEPAEGGVQFTVRDTGCGIAPEQIGTIFERFSQGKPSDRRGLGLGLYIARCVVEAHGGRIWAESEPGKGSAFHFTLPAAPAARGVDPG